MGYFQVRYDSRVVNYDHIGFIELATGEKHLNQLQIRNRNIYLYFKFVCS